MTAPPPGPGLRAVLRDAWGLTAPYFNSEERWRARTLLAAIVLANLSLVGITVILNFWNGAFFDAIQNKDAESFISLLLTWRAGEPSFVLSGKGSFMPGFVLIATAYIVIFIYATYLRQGLQMDWRRWMTRRLLSAWLADRAYYTIGLQAQGGAGFLTDNPDQRIAEDCRTFTEDTLRLGLSLMRNVVTLVTFAEILWVLSGVITVMGVEIPGYMLFVAIVYAVVGTWLTHLVGRPLAVIEFQRQRLEADFRYALVRVRENAEGVALYAGEAAERAGLLDRFALVVMNWRQYMVRTKKLNALTTGYGQVASIFPIAVASPRYFAGEIALGGLTRISDAFSSVQGALSWFLDAYQQLAVWRATVDRLAGFERAVAAARALAAGGVRVRVGEAGAGQAGAGEAGAGEAGAVALDGVRIALPDGRVLLDQASLRLGAGQSTVISGRSGSGKSTLFRAIAGIWPFGSGTVVRPPGTQLFLPQRPYIPLGTLRHAIAYPADAAAFPDAAVHEALADAGLGALAPELDADQPWAQRLSGGEQQRLAIARALLLRPDWLFMDEATASLDPVAQAELYARLRERLPGTTILSIAHRAEVAAWHDSALVLRDGRLNPA